MLVKTVFEALSITVCQLAYCKQYWADQLTICLWGSSVWYVPIGNESIHENISYDQYKIWTIFDDLFTFVTLLKQTQKKERWLQITR